MEVFAYMIYKRMYNAQCWTLRGGAHLMSVSVFIQTIHKVLMMFLDLRIFYFYTGMEFLIRW